MQGLIAPVISEMRKEQHNEGVGRTSEMRRTTGMFPGRDCSSCQLPLYSRANAALPKLTFP